MRTTLRRVMRRIGGSRGDCDRSSRCCFRKRGGLLEIDCMGCQGRRDLTSPTCLRAVLDIMAGENGVRSVMLAGEWENLYAGECVEVLQSLSGLLRYCQDMSRRDAPFGICETCPLSPGSFYSRISGTFPDILNVGEIPHRDNRLPKYDGACEECRLRAISNVDHIHRELSAVGRSIARHAFHIVGEGDD